jgi:hypothetical protein
MFKGVHIEGNFQAQGGMTNIFSQISEILNHHDPQKEPDYFSRGLHPMISPDQAARELLEILKNPTINNN